MDREPSYFFNFEKLAYIRGSRPGVDCILCGIRDQDPQVVNLGLDRSEHWITTLNLYPFNPGHLMVFPLRHVVDIAELSPAEVLDLHRLTARACTMLRETHHARGFNIGFNMGLPAGASIAHLHQHIIPRHEREIGMAELIGGTRVMVQDPAVTRDILVEWLSTHP